MEHVSQEDVSPVVEPGDVLLKTNRQLGVGLDERSEGVGVLDRLWGMMPPWGWAVLE